MKNISDLIIELHELARTMEDFEESIKVRYLADELAKIGNRFHEKFLESQIVKNRILVEGLEK